MPFRRGPRAVCFFIAALWLFGTALPAWPAEPEGIWLDIPFVRQEKNGCGSAAVAMLLGYWAGRAPGVSTPPASEIQRELYSAEARGIYASAVENYLQARGFRTFALDGRWEDLRHHLAKGRPLLVALKDGSLRHYVVVAGIDDRSVEMNDPARGKLLRMGRGEFEKHWSAAGHWLLLAVPRS